LGETPKKKKPPRQGEGKIDASYLNSAVIITGTKSLS
jgi:hypothetical protein